MEYPTDIVMDDTYGWGRIHRGHGLDHDVLRADLDAAQGPRKPYDLRIEEVWFRYHPRVKWCERLDGTGCDSNGDWHGHWTAARPGSPDAAFTVVRPMNEAAPTHAFGERVLVEVK